MGFSLQNGNRKLLRLFVSFFVFLTWSTCSIFAENTVFLPIRDIKTGMKGHGKTVICGRRIESFDVEILGILSNNKVTENLLINGKSILVKVSGEVIKKAGGIAAGMSGSPVYIDGKLIGGISSGWIMTDHTVGLVTPIEEMIEIWSYPEISTLPNEIKPIKWELETPVRFGKKKSITTIWELAYNQPDNFIIPEDNELIFKQAAAEIFIDGLGKQATEVLKTRMKKKNIHVIQKMPEKDHSAIEDEFEQGSDSYLPGSAIGIQLARGDINLTTLGTLTYRDGNKILALAHSFLKKGQVSYLLTGAYIHHSFSSVEMPFKIGAPTEMLGIISQDREKGLAGEIEKFPEMVPIQIDIIDKDLQITRNLNFQIVKDSSIFGAVLESTLIQALTGIIDREGAGTALMGISLDCASKSGKEYSFRRENMFYSKTDIVQSLISEIINLIDMTTESDLEEVMPTRLLLKIEIEKRRRTLTIEKVEIKNHSVSGGGVLDVEVTMRPFREKNFIRKVKIPIPQDIGKENLTLSVSGLNMRVDDAEQNIDTRESQTRDNKIDGTTTDDFDSVIRSWASSPKNSDLLFQLSVEGEEMKKIKLSGRDIEIQPTSFVVTGRVDTTLTLSEE